MICDCPLANVCVHAAKVRSGWRQFVYATLAAGVMASPWVLLMLLGRMAWGWM